MMPANVGPWCSDSASNTVKVSSAPLCSCPASGTNCDNTCYLINGFANYVPGSINLQNGWTTQDNFTSCQTVGNWDQAIVDANGKRVWQISNADINPNPPGFTALPMSYVSTAVAGETGASLFNNRGPNGCGTNPIFPPTGDIATTTKFYMRTDFRSATGAAQPNLTLALSAGAKQSASRMTNLRIYDNGVSGFNLVFTDAKAAAPPIVVFTDTTIASNLSYTDLHRLEVTIEFVNGINNNAGSITGNDIVKVRSGQVWSG